MGMGFPFGSARRACATVSGSSSKVVGGKVVYVTPPVPEPNPADFVIQQCIVRGIYTLAVIKYPACTTFEGRKVCIYRCSEKQLRAATRLDPHFIEEPGSLSPVARFKPTIHGMMLANKFLDLLAEGHGV